MLWVIFYENIIGKDTNSIESRIQICLEHSTSKIQHSILTRKKIETWPFIDGYSLCILVCLMICRSYSMDFTTYILKIEWHKILDRYFIYSIISIIGKWHLKSNQISFLINLSNFLKIFFDSWLCNSNNISIVIIFICSFITVCYRTSLSISRSSMKERFWETIIVSILIWSWILINSSIIWGIITTNFSFI